MREQGHRQNWIMGPSLWFLWHGVGPGGCCPQQEMTAPPVSVILIVGRSGGLLPIRRAPPGLPDGFSKIPKTFGRLRLGWLGDS